MTEPDNDNLDRLLDSLLSNYSREIPRPGLETRIRAGLEAAAVWKPRWFLNWKWAGAAVAAAIAAAVIFYLGHSPAAPISSKPELVQKQPIPEPASTVRDHTIRSVAQAGAQYRRSKTQVLQVADDRPDVFPTPSPLSEQEKLLLRYMAGTPRQEIIAQARTDDLPAEPDSDQDQLNLIRVPQRQISTQ